MDYWVQMVQENNFFKHLSRNCIKTAVGLIVWGFDIDKNPRQVKASIGIVPQEVNLRCIFSVQSNYLELQAGFYGVIKKDRITEIILNMVALDKQANSYSRSLSGGMKEDY